MNLHGVHSLVYTLAISACSAGPIAVSHRP